MAITQTRTQAKPANAGRTPVSKIMSRDVVTVQSGTSLESVVELMLSRGLSRVPVVDAQEHPLGIISKTDVVEESHERGDDGETDQKGAQRGFHVHPEGTIADEVMSRTLITVPADASVSRVAELMVSRHVHGVPVVAKDGGLVGFVSTMDVLAWLAGLR